MRFRLLRQAVLALCLGSALPWAVAQPHGGAPIAGGGGREPAGARAFGPPGDPGGRLSPAAGRAVPRPAAPPAHEPANVGEWLARMHQASRQRAYAGTFVVSSADGAMSSARIWHVCNGDDQMERVESLSGVPRTTYRRNDEVVTFLPESKVARAERREALGLFPNLLQTRDAAIAEFYAARKVGSDRVAGFDADVVNIAPKDNLRYGYRIWSEKQSGLVVKMQTLDTEGRVLEQSAFSELQLDAPVRMDRLAQMMANTEGYRVERPLVAKADPAAEGWAMAAPVAGFEPMSCNKRRAAGAPPEAGMLQWIFSDGMASVSLFIENYEPRRHPQEAVLSMGATQTLTRRIGDWWLTAVGEVPAPTLRAFAQGLERRKTGSN